ncbi:unnamed protein product [Urochloa decumbens]|uniref:Ubiquitin-like domain-containing protein n=1 Tax=Urochloa decumbens TaxID=240449 RepID=A0ABC9CUV4_9POAL
MRCWGCGRGARRRRRNGGSRALHDRGGDGGGGARAAPRSGRGSCGDGGDRGPTDRAGNRRQPAALRSGLRSCVDGGDQGKADRAGDGRQAAALGSGDRCCDSVRPPAVAAVGSAPASTPACNKEDVKGEAHVKEKTSIPSTSCYTLLTISRSNETVVILCSGEYWSTNKITVCGYLYRNNASQSNWKMLSNTSCRHQKNALDEKVGVPGDFVGSAGTSLCSPSKDNDSEILEAEDILPDAEKRQNITLPGFSGDGNKPCRKQAGTSLCPSSKDNNSKILEAQDLLPDADKRQNITLPGFSGDGNKLCKQLQFTVKASNGTSVSVQKDIDSTTVGSLIESICEKLGVPALDGYAVLEGKALNSDEYLSHYSISRDSNVEIRLRLRAGQYVTFDDKFDIDEIAMFDEITLPPMLIKQGVAIPTTSVKFFSYLSTCYLHEILKCVTGLHRVGWSFNGGFDSRDILFVGGRVYISSAQVGFNEISCANDYYRLYEIFSRKFSGYGYPVYFSHLLQYLRTCPAKGLSNTEAVIGFVTNHPCLEHYQDRMKQIMVLDNIVPRLDAADLQTLTNALGTYQDWVDNHVHGVPEMDGVYYFFNTVNVNGVVMVNPLYQDTPRGCLHYSNNYMKHVTNQVDVEVLEAAYCLHFDDFLPEMLLRIALHQHLHQNKSIVALLCNRLADKGTKERSD